jgi:transposase InsO family protein
MDYKLYLNNPDINTNDRYLLILIDLLSKHVWYSTSETRKKEIVAEWLEKLRVQFEEEGLPPIKVLQSDNGGEFKNDAVSEWAAKHNVKLTHGLPGHPQADGVVERVIQTISNMLMKEVPGLGICNNRVERESKVPLDWVSK